MQTMCGMPIVSVNIERRGKKSRKWLWFSGINEPISIDKIIIDGRS